MDEMDEIIEEFLVESHENLDRLDAEFVRLETTPDDVDVLAGIFRDIHTIKGTSGFLGYGQLEAVAHVGEHLLSQLRDRELVLTAERTSALLAMVDAIREVLAAIKSKGNEGDGVYDALVARLGALAEPEGPVVDPVSLPIGTILAEHAGVSEDDLAADVGGSQYTLQIPGSTPLNEVWFVTAEQPLMVQVLQRTSADVAAHV